MSSESLRWNALDSNAIPYRWSDGNYYPNLLLQSLFDQWLHVSSRILLYVLFHIDSYSSGKRSFPSSVDALHTCVLNGTCLQRKPGLFTHVSILICSSSRCLSTLTGLHWIEQIQSPGYGVFRIMSRNPIISWRRVIKLLYSMNALWTMDTIRCSICDIWRMWVISLVSSQMHTLWTCLMSSQNWRIVTFTPNKRWRVSITLFSIIAHGLH